MSTRYTLTFPSGNIMRVKKEGWVYVAQLKDFEGKPVSALTLSMVDATGGDQMKITHTKIFFSAEVDKFSKSYFFLFQYNTIQYKHGHFILVLFVKPCAQIRLHKS